MCLLETRGAYLTCMFFLLFVWKSVESELDCRIGIDYISMVTVFRSFSDVESIYSFSLFCINCDLICSNCAYCQAEFPATWDHLYAR